jgi:hypothetical protein
MLGVTAGPIADDADHPIAPKNLRFPNDREEFGDFDVCPFTQEHKGWMQFVCIEKAENLFLK